MYEIGDIVHCARATTKGPFVVAGYVYYRKALFYIGINDQGEEADLQASYTHRMEAYRED